MPQRLGAILAVAFGVSLSVIDGTVANVALPTIGLQLGISAADSIWIVNVYSAGHHGLAVSSRRWVVGYRKVYIGGLMLSTVASVGCSGSGSPRPSCWRASCRGSSAAITSVTSLIRLSTPRPGWDAHGRQRQVVANFRRWPGRRWAAGILRGRLAALFAVNVLIGLAALALSRRFLPENPAWVREHRRLARRSDETP